MTIGYTIISVLKLRHDNDNQAFGSKLLLLVNELLVILHPVDNELYIQFIFPDLYQHIVASY